MSLKELICNDDGKVSRTQCTILFAFLYTFVLLTIEVFLRLIESEKTVITFPVGIALFMVFVFAIVDRMDTRRLTFRVSKTGVEVEAHNDNNNDASGGYRSENFDRDETYRTDRFDK